MFDRAMKGYSSASWTEIVEGLCFKYTAKELGAIKRVFTNIEVPFAYQALSERISKLGEIDKEYMKLKESHNLREILDDLFELGVIGNTGQRMIFKFMEDDDLALTEDMMIHKPLRNFFAVKSRKVSYKDIYEEENDINLKYE